MDTESGDGVKTIKVGVIAHVHDSMSGRTALIISALRAMQNVEVVELSEKDVLLVEDGVHPKLIDQLKDYPESTRFGNEMISPYAGSGRRGKGERKRERAVQRRFYGKRNSF